jgi:hypothetical protein
MGGNDMMIHLKPPGGDERSALLRTIGQLTRHRAQLLDAAEHALASGDLRSLRATIEQVREEIDTHRAKITQEKTK